MTTISYNRMRIATILIILMSRSVSSQEIKLKRTSGKEMSLSYTRLLSLNSSEKDMFSVKQSFSSLNFEVSHPLKQVHYSVAYGLSLYTFRSKTQFYFSDPDFLKFIEDASFKTVTKDFGREDYMVEKYSLPRPSANISIRRKWHTVLWDFSLIARASAVYLYWLDIDVAFDIVDSYSDPLAEYQTALQYETRSTKRVPIFPIVELNGEISRELNEMYVGFVGVGSAFFPVNFGSTTYSYYPNSSLKKSGSVNFPRMYLSVNLGIKLLLACKHEKE